MAEEVMTTVSRKTPEEIELLRQGGRGLAVILRDLVVAARPGVSTKALDAMAERMIRDAGGDPIFKGYRIPEVKALFPASICTSINDEVVHGIPREDRFLAEGDILSIDIGMRWPKPETGNRKPDAGARSSDFQFPVSGVKRSMVTDMAITIGMGKISSDAERLIRATREALDAAVAAIRPGATLGDIGYAVERRLKKDHLGIIRDLAGHGVGYELHEPPMIPNFGTQGAGLKLQEGMVIAVEPMATLGTWRITLDKDEWTFRTADKSLAAHFEYTIAVTASGAEVLTRA